MMTMLGKATFMAALVLVGACISTESRGQADPDWLRAWNEAQKTRPANPASSSRIAAAAEPGTALIISGQLVGPDGRTPAAGVMVHAYHRDQQGFDFGAKDNALPTWRLQGWARTDAQGRFEFHTIRPAADHLGREAAHVHFTLDSPQSGRQWAPTVYLADDTRVTTQQRRRSAADAPFPWVVDVTTDPGGVQRMQVRLKLKPSGDF